MSRGPAGVGAVLLGASLVLAAALGACGGARAPGAPSAGAAATVVHSNVTRSDYAGSASCQPCHADLYARWQTAPMHRMTQRADQAVVHTPFDGRSFRFKDDTATLSTVDGARYLRLTSKFGNGLFHVTKIIGGHHREDFAGVPVAREAPGAILGDPHGEKVLPVSYVIGTGELRYKGYSVMATERPGMKAAPVWSKTCIFCHNTEPYLATAFGGLIGPRPPKYQGEMVDTLLPAARQQTLVIDDEDALRRAVADELRFQGADVDTSRGSIANVLRDAISTTRAQFDETKLLEVGIGCESCHGGSREHVQDPRVKPSFAPVTPMFHATGFGLGGGHDPATSINRACARCHQVLFSRYPFTWEGGMRSSSPGGSNINSGEARDFLLGGCAGAMSCADCHDPHANDGGAKARAVETLAGNATCLRCHGKLAGDVALAAHTHHAAKGAGSVCTSCHMPRKNMALDTTLGPYHRIGSPTDKVRVEKDRPLECALCHADKDVTSLVSAMERWWSKSYDREALQKLYGAPESNVLLATMMRGKAHEQAPAIFTLGEKKDRAAAPGLGVQMTHAIPLLRYYARDALAKILGGPAPVNLHQEDDAIRAETDAWLRANGVTPMRAAGGKAETDDGAEE